MKYIENISNIFQLEQDQPNTERIYTDILSSDRVNEGEREREKPMPSQIKRIESKAMGKKN